MTMKFIYYITILTTINFTLSSANCLGQSQYPKPKFDWLVGKWQFSHDSKSYEEWIKVDSDKLLGKSYTISDRDTIIHETIKISQIGTDYWYIPSVADQNNGQPVYFKLIVHTDTTLLFHNPNHDFPQFIKYNYHDPDTLKASISGDKKGTSKTIDFMFIRKEE